MKILFKEGEIECSEQSCKDFTREQFVDIADGAYVYGSCFSKEMPDTVIFRADMKGVTFRNCNLMNVRIPDGNTVIDCQTQRFTVQNDGNDWVIGEDGKPVEPLNSLIFRKRGLPLPDPKEIPLLPVEKPVDLVAAAEAKAGR